MYPTRSFALSESGASLEVHTLGFRVKGLGFRA